MWAPWLAAAVVRLLATQFGADATPAVDYTYCGDAPRCRQFGDPFSGIFRSFAPGATHAATAPVDFSLRAAVRSCRGGVLQCPGEPDGCNATRWLLCGVDSIAESTVPPSSAALVEGIRCFQTTFPSMKPGPAAWKARATHCYGQSSRVVACAAGHRGGVLLRAAADAHGRQFPASCAAGPGAFAKGVPRLTINGEVTPTAQGAGPIIRTLCEIGAKPTKPHVCPKASAPRSSHAAGHPASAAAGDVITAASYPPFPPGCVGKIGAVTRHDKRGAGTRCGKFLDFVGLSARMPHGGDSYAYVQKSRRNRIDRRPWIMDRLCHDRYLYDIAFNNHEYVSRSIPPPWGSIRFRPGPRTHAPRGARVVSQTKSRKIPT